MSNLRTWQRKYLIGAAAIAPISPFLLLQGQITRWKVGILPDADVFITSASDPLLAIEYHRGFTHALAFIPLGGAIAALPWLAAKKNRRQWKPVMGAALAAYAHRFTMTGARAAD